MIWEWIGNSSIEQAMNSSFLVIQLPFIFFKYPLKRMAIFCCYQLTAATTALGVTVTRVIRACLPIRCDSIETCWLLAIRSLPTDSPLAPHLADTAHGHQVTAPPYCLPTEQPSIPIPSSLLPIPPITMPPSDRPVAIATDKNKPPNPDCHNSTLYTYSTYTRLARQRTTSLRVPYRISTLRHER